MRIEAHCRVPVVKNINFYLMSGGGGGKKRGNREGEWKRREIVKEMMKDEGK
jgi:hypothetical protein